MSYDDILFHERHYLPKWIWIIISFPTLLFWGIAYVQLVLNMKVGNHPMSDLELIIVIILFGLLLPMLFFFMHGEILVTKQNIIISLIPIYKKKIHIDNIKEIKQIGLKTIQNFGSWGLRWNGQTFGFIFEGNSGIEIYLIDGKSCVISSKNSEELYKTLKDRL